MKNTEKAKSITSNGALGRRTRISPYSSSGCDLRFPHISVRWSYFLNTSGHRSPNIDAFSNALASWSTPKPGEGECRAEGSTPVRSR